MALVNTSTSPQLPPWRQPPSNNTVATATCDKSCTHVHKRFRHRRETVSAHVRCLWRNTADRKKRLRRKEPVAGYIYVAINTSQSETSHWELNEPLKSGDELADRRDWSAVISFAGPCSSRRWLVEREAGVTGDDEGAAEEKREGGEGASRFEEGSLQSAVVPHPVWCSVCKYLEREREKKERGGLTGWLTRGVFFCCCWVQVVCIAEGSLLCLSLGFLPEKNIFKCS